MSLFYYVLTIQHFKYFLNIQVPDEEDDDGDNHDDNSENSREVREDDDIDSNEKSYAGKNSGPDTSLTTKKSTGEKRLVDNIAESDSEDFPIVRTLNSNKKKTRRQFG